MKIIETSSGDKDWMSKKWDEINENIVGMKKDILNDQNVKEVIFVQELHYFYLNLQNLTFIGQQ